MSLRDEHFKRLNGYRNSREYAAYALEIGNSPPITPNPPTLLGVRWPIDSSLYNEFLEMLPPMRWRGGSFLMREFCFGSITTKYTKEGDRYYCEFVDASK